MINWPLSRDDIKVWREGDGTLKILIGDKMNNFGASAKRGTTAMAAIQSLMELMNRKVLGVTETDFIVKVDEFFESEKNAED